MKALILTILFTFFALSAYACQMISGELKADAEGKVYINGTSWKICENKNCPVRNRLLRCVREEVIYRNDVSKKKEA